MSLWKWSRRDEAGWPISSIGLMLLMLDLDACISYMRSADYAEVTSRHLETLFVSFPPYPIIVGSRRTE